MSEPHYPGCYPEWLVKECRKHTPEQEEHIKQAAAIVQRKMEELGMTADTQEQDLPEVEMDSVIPFDKGVDASLLHNILEVVIETFELWHIELSQTDTEAIRRAAAVIQATLTREVRFKG